MQVEEGSEDAGVATSPTETQSEGQEANWSKLAIFVLSILLVVLIMSEYQKDQLVEPDQLESDQLVESTQKRATTDVIRNCLIALAAMGAPMGTLKSGDSGSK